jgi:adenosylcobinamide-GDP ribazoletransferase
MTARLRGLATDISIGILFCTRLPLPHAMPVEGAEVARASWALPIAGALVGVGGAVVYSLAHAVGLTPWPAAALTLAATAALTGCLHEDGLADTADGFGGGTTGDRKLEIMRDSRIGTYGVCAVALSLLLRVGAVASLADPALVAPALIAAHAAARASLPAFMRALPQARADGLAAAVGSPPRASVMASLAIGVLVLGLGLGVPRGGVALILLALALAAFAWLTKKQIGGQTGDVLGALEQIGEILVLLVAAARS